MPADLNSIEQVFANLAVQFEGCGTVNFGMTAAPKVVGDVDLVDELRERAAWFATAPQVVAWFRKRRSGVFERANPEIGARVTAPLQEKDKRTCPIWNYEGIMGPRPTGARRSQRRRPELLACGKQASAARGLKDGRRGMCGLRKLSRN